MGQRRVLVGNMLPPILSQAAEEPSMSDPYAPQPPYSPDPYQQQPYGAQPAYGQPAYEQPAYGQPVSPQPAYGQPDYNAQGGYPQPQPYPGQPAWGGPVMEPPKKSRTALIVSLVVAGVALVVCGGIAAVAYNFDSGKDTPDAAASGGASTAGPNRSGATTSSGKTPTLTAPATIGSWKKSASQDQADLLSKQLSDAGVKNPFAAQYQDKTKSTKTVAVWGGTGAIFSAGGAQKQLDAFFTGIGKTLNGGESTTPIKVDPGSVGGTAECSKIDNSGITFSVCAWVNTNVLLAFMFNAIEPDAAGAQVRILLPAIVTT